LQYLTISFLFIFGAAAIIFESILGQSSVLESPNGVERNTMPRVASAMAVSGGFEDSHDALMSI
jgi:hypothetical protein